MKKKSYKRPIALLIAVIGAYHVVLFALHPRLPPVAKAEVVWGELSSDAPSQQASQPATAEWCATVQSRTTDNRNTPSGEPFDRVRFQYRPEADNFLNTGHAAQIIMASGSSLTIGKVSYPLVAIQFENATTGNPMTFHLIHRLNDGKVAVVSVPLQITEQSNPTITALWRYLPQRPGEHNSLDDLHVDINRLLPEDRTYYRYQAANSCSGKMVWLGLKNPVQISSEQAAKLNKVLRERPVTASL